MSRILPVQLRCGRSCGQFHDYGVRFQYGVHTEFPGRRGRDSTVEYVLHKWGFPVSSNLVLVLVLNRTGRRLRTYGRTPIYTGLVLLGSSSITLLKKKTNYEVLAIVVVLRSMALDLFV